MDAEPRKRCDSKMIRASNTMAAIILNAWTVRLFKQPSQLPGHLDGRSGDLAPHPHPAAPIRHPDADNTAPHLLEPSAEQGSQESSNRAAGRTDSSIPGILLRSAGHGPFKLLSVVQTAEGPIIKVFGLRWRFASACQPSRRLLNGSSFPAQPIQIEAFTDEIRRVSPVARSAHERSSTSSPLPYAR